MAYYTSEDHTIHYTSPKVKTIFFRDHYDFGTKIEKVRIFRETKTKCSVS